MPYGEPPPYCFSYYLLINKWEDFFLLQPYLRDKTERWDRYMYQRDIRLTGNAYNCSVSICLKFVYYFAWTVYNCDLLINPPSVASEFGHSEPNRHTNFNSHNFHPTQTRRFALCIDLPGDLNQRIIFKKYLKNNRFISMNTWNTKV